MANGKKFLPVSIQMEFFALIWAILGAIFFIIYLMTKSLIPETLSFLFFFIAGKYIAGAIKRKDDIRKERHP